MLLNLSILYFTITALDLLFLTLTLESFSILLNVLARFFTLTPLNFLSLKLVLGLQFSPFANLSNRLAFLTTSFN